MSFKSGFESKERQRERERESQFNTAGGSDSKDKDQVWRDSVLEHCFKRRLKTYNFNIHFNTNFY